MPVSESRHTCHSHRFGVRRYNYLVTNNHPVVSTRKEQTMNAQRIEGAVALVTGANRGLGQALVDGAPSRGAQRVYAGTRQQLTYADGGIMPRDVRCD